MLIPPSRPFSRRPAFTLIELLVAMSIILILAGIVIGVQRGVYRSQSEARARSELAAMATALEGFKLKYGDYPWLGQDTDGTGLFNVLSGRWVMYRNTSGQVTVGPRPSSGPGSQLVPTVYLGDGQVRTDSKTAPTRFLDPWGQPYRYYYKPNNTNPDTSPPAWRNPSFILMSSGPDAQMTHTSAGGFDGSTGYINRSTYFNSTNVNNRNFDNIVYGLEL